MIILGDRIFSHYICSCINPIAKQENLPREFIQKKVSENRCSYVVLEIINRFVEQ